MAPPSPTPAPASAAESRPLQLVPVACQPRPTRSPQHFIPNRVSFPTPQPLQIPLNTPLKAYRASITPFSIPLLHTMLLTTPFALDSPEALLVCSPFNAIASLLSLFRNPCHFFTSSPLP
ncbi:uncharacterized protein BT62DRAFT_929586 [Guyanagaster necrorhizus]|uniref:Uncharacterized protein n=1 Tax=Guyanagaster necrorhizus TaxID=856835 RepID=A0A9P7VVX0_9AGAR|nr:uncharacterized protein BT62DRAFT_929586 [Guyanagaster necrorhizus MCA 3950]KAG7448501.1 hypothetical protein BT62DRAFT_929586 [Guyanagaster necrorhizus MCA 3950]